MTEDGKYTSIHEFLTNVRGLIDAAYNEVAKVSQDSNTLINTLATENTELKQEVTTLKDQLGKHAEADKTEQVD